MAGLAEMDWCSRAPPLLAHATVLLWKALDPRYIDEAQWIVDVILKPLHPLGLMGVVMPPLRTLVSNMPPSHLDADKVSLWLPRAHLHGADPGLATGAALGGNGQRLRRPK